MHREPVTDCTKDLNESLIEEEISQQFFMKIIDALDDVREINYDKSILHNNKNTVQKYLFSVILLLSTLMATIFLILFFGI